MTLTDKSSRRHGFALVVTLSLMILLTLLAVGLLSLSGIALRASQQGESQAIARTNARLAMMLALGELQKFAGPDQRVTANASQLETARSKVVNRQWSGVWRTDGMRTETGAAAIPIINRLTTTTGTDAGSLQDRREDGRTYNRTNEALTWLVSTPTPATRLNPATALTAATSVLLVGPGSTTTLAADQVSAPRVSLKPGATVTGGYAWWVADEGCKARFNLPNAPKGTTNPTPAWLNPAQEGISTMVGLDQYETLTDPNLAKTVSRRTGDLAYPAQTTTPSPFQSHFHDLSFHSAGVLADTQNGGLRRDLSAFLATGSLPAAGNLPAMDSNTPILNAPMLKLISARFGMLKSWNDLAAKIDSSGNLDVVPPMAVANGIGASTVRPGSAGYDLAHQSVTPIHPVIVDAGISYGVSLFSTGAAGTAPGSLKYKVRVHYYPRLVLWNPYQAGLKATAYAVQFAMPDTFYINLNDPSLPAGGVQLKFFDSVANGYLTAGGSNNMPNRPVFMVPATSFKPGEALLFTADASGTPDRTTPWGDAGTAAATSIGNFRLACNKPLPLQDSFMLESQYTVDLPANALTAGTATYQIGASNSADPSAKKQYWYKLWQLKGATGSGSIAGLLGNDTTNYPPLQYIDQSECGTLASYAPWFGSIPASVSERLRETKDPRNPFYRFKWGHRFQWFTDTNENLGVKPGNFNTPYLDYNLLANHNLRASWHCWAPVEVFFRASATGGRYVHGVMIDDPYGWDWTNPQLAPVPVNGQNRVSPFGAPAQFGGQTFPLLSIPRKDVPVLSLGAFQHVPLSPFFWHPTYAFGNSLADPRGQRQRTTNYVDSNQWNTVGVNAHSWQEYRQGQLNGQMNNQAVLYDLSYEANFALWDSYFLSTIPRPYTPANPLPNSRILPQGDSPAVQADLLNGNRAAASLLLDGAFNVNSTSEDAWAALFATFRENPALEVTLADGSKVRANDVYSRLIQPAGTAYNNNGATDPITWNGYRKLSDTQIRNLAREIVVEVKQRGPFLSVADFVNRRLVIPPTSSGAETPLTLTGVKGALQAALDRSTINDTLANAFKIAKSEYNMGGPSNEWQVTYGSNYPTPVFPLTSGNLPLGPKPDHNHWADSKLVGAPCFLTQADVLQKIGPLLSARSDTFTIRTYGECRDAAGNVTGRAWAEAVVQRKPQPLNSSAGATDTSGLNPIATGLGQFGRRFDIVTYRWLNPAEL